MAIVTEIVKTWDLIQANKQSSHTSTRLDQQDYGSQFSSCCDVGRLS